jgi:quercetin dioxygenase-like cupin family protein
VVLFAMDAEQEMSEHRAPFPATLQVLEGRLRMTVGKINREMTARDWLVMPADAPHSLFAVEPTRFILTLLKRQST